MRTLQHLFEKNRKWAESMEASDPAFFLKLSRQQSPDYLWIGCSDSRVPAPMIVGLLPGDIFVQRNVANVVVHTDLNCLSTIQYATDVLNVKHIIVCGHYGCGGVLAAMRGERLGLIDNWLRHVQDVRQKHESQLMAISDEDRRWDRLCELHVIEPVMQGISWQKRGNHQSGFTENDQEKHHVEPGAKDTPPGIEVPIEMKKDVEQFRQPFHEFHTPCARGSFCQFHRGKSTALVLALCSAHGSAGNSGDFSLSFQNEFEAKYVVYASLTERIKLIFLLTIQQSETLLKSMKNISINSCWK